MPCDIEQKSPLEQAADFVACPNSMIPEFKRDAMIMASILSNSGSSIVTEVHDEIDITYHGSTNNPATVVYSLNGTVVATLTISYVGGVPSSDDALISNVIKS